MNRTLALALIAALSFGSAAMANDAPASADAAAAHAKMDRAGMKKHHEEKFAKADKDGDGTLSRDEFQASHAERANKAFDMMDANKDGKLSKEELKEGRKVWHQKMRDHRKMDR